MKRLSKFKIGLAIAGICGAAFYLTVPATILSFIAYAFMASLVLPLAIDIFNLGR
jgi:hypothetical protein|tara:strand:+ start:79 stop:243 length:165 start_codon:yes stop_codon:yes gene_type:complete